MCGPSGSEKSLASGEESFSTSLQGAFNTRLGQQSATLANLNRTLNPILAAGPNQEGFSAPEKAALNTQAINTTAGNYANAARAAGNRAAANNGSSSGLQTGGEQQIQGDIAAQGASQLSSEQEGITEADYATGRQEYNTALSGTESLAGLENPDALGSLANNANSTAFGEEKDIEEQEGQKYAEIGGLVSGGLSALSGGLAGGLGGGGAKGFFKGLNANS